MHIHIGGHLGGDRNVQGLGLATGRQPIVVQHPGAVFQAHQQAAFADGGQFHPGGFANLVAFLVRGQGQAGGGILAATGLIAAPAQVGGLGSTVIALPVTDSDQVAAPAIVAAIQSPLPPAFCIRGQLRLGNHLGVRVADEVAQVLAGAVPPPAPVNFVDGDIQGPAGHRFALAVHADQVDGMLALTGQGTAPATALRHLHAGPVFEGVHRHTADLGAVIAAVLEHPGGEGGTQHARSLLHRNGEREAGLSLPVHMGLEGGEWLAAEGAAAVVKMIGIETIEAGGGGRHPHFHIRFQVGGGGTVEPLGKQAHLRRFVGGQLLGQFQVDLQPVGLDRFHPHRGIEIALAQPGHGPPVTGGRVFVRAQGKGIEVTHWLV